MRKILSVCLLFIVLSLIFSSCEEDNPVESNPQDIIGSWTRVVTDSEGLEFEAKLIIDNNSYEFIVLSDVPNHNDSTAEYVIENGMIKIINDDDCFNIIGFYNFSVKNDKLTLTSYEDLCDGRRIALNGVWTKV